MKIYIKRSLSFLLMVALTFTLLTSQALAEVESGTSTGTTIGTASNPSIFTTPSIANLKVKDATQLPFNSKSGAVLLFSFDYNNLNQITSNVSVQISHMVNNTKVYVKQTTYSGLIGLSGNGTVDYGWNGIDTNTNQPAAEDTYTIELTGSDVYNNMPVTLGSITPVTFQVKYPLIVQPIQNPQVSVNISTPTTDYTTYNAGGVFNFGFNFATTTANLDIIASVRAKNSTSDLKTFAYTFPSTTSGTKKITWDGKDNNNSVVPEGSYNFHVSGMSNGSSVGPLDASFDIVAPVLDAPKVSTLTYNPSVDGALTVSGNILNLSPNSKANVSYVIAQIAGQQPNQTYNFIYAKQFTQIGNGSHSFTWDGTGAVAGNYTVFYTGTYNGIKFNPPQIASIPPFSITNTAPAQQNSSTNVSISNLGVTPNPVDPSKNAILTYTVNNWTSATKTDVGIYDLNNAVVKQWTGVVTQNGVNTLTWTPSTTLADGLYIFEVKGMDGSLALPVQKIVLTVSKFDSTSHCANSTDVLASDPDCAALTYFKANGIIVGDNTGAFLMNDNVQRGQITKILLVSRHQIDLHVDNCAGVNLLKDMVPSNWALPYICRGMKIIVAGKPMISGYTSGPDKGYFRPERYVNRAEFVTLVFRPLSPVVSTENYPDVPADAYFSEYAKSAKYYQLFTGNFSGGNYMTRREVVQALWKLHLQGVI